MKFRLFLLVFFSMNLWAQDFKIECEFTNHESNSIYRIIYQETIYGHGMTLIESNQTENYVSELKNIQVMEEELKLMSREEIETLFQLISNDQILEGIDFSKPIKLRSYTGYIKEGYFKDLNVSIVLFLNSQNEQVAKMTHILLQGFGCKN